jgi:hypothetical protein
VAAIHLTPHGSPRKPQQEPILQSRVTMLALWKFTTRLNSTARFGNKNNFPLLLKHSSWLQQRWRWSCNLRSRRIGSRFRLARTCNSMKSFSKLKRDIFFSFSVPPHLKGDGVHDITLKKGRPIRYDLWCATLVFVKACLHEITQKQSRATQFWVVRHNYNRF